MTFTPASLHMREPQSPPGYYATGYNPEGSHIPEAFTLQSILDYQKYLVRNTLDCDLVYEFKFYGNSGFLHERLGFLGLSDTLACVLGYDFQFYGSSGFLHIRPVGVGVGVSD